MKSIVALIGAMILSALGLRSVTAPSAPVADFLVSPANPAVGQVAGFIDSSTGSPTAWSWNFGDGQISTEHNPTHVYAAPGSYVVTLSASNSSGSNDKVRDVIVSPSDTLRLNVAGQHPFLVTVQASNPSTGETGPGFAIPQNDIFGYFSLPALTRNPDNPEVAVKILDGNFFNSHYWVFYGGMTSLEYTVTVQDELTGETKSYLKPAGSADGGADTSAFAGAAKAGSTAAWRTAETIALSSLASRAPAFPQAPIIETISASPVNPVTNQLVRLLPLNFGKDDLLQWTVAPGVVVQEREPVYAYPAPGDYALGVLDMKTHEYASETLTVSRLDELRLLAGAEPVREFIVGLTARDPGTGKITQGRAFANSAVFGSFSIGNSNNAEVFAKVLDGHGVNNADWVFYGGLTNRQLTLSIKYTFSNDTKYYFKPSQSYRGGYDTDGFDVTRQPVIDSISPSSGTFGTTIRLLGSKFYGNLYEPFFVDSNGQRPLQNEKYLLQKIKIGIDAGTGKNFMDLQLTNPLSTPLTAPLTFPLAVAIDHRLAFAPVSFTLLPLGTTPVASPTSEPTNATPAPTLTPTPPGPTATPNLPTNTPTFPPTNTPTFPGPTATPLPGSPVVTATSTDDVYDGTIFDIFGMNLGACNVASATFEGTPGVFLLTCQTGDAISMRVQVPVGGVIPVGSYNVCVTRKMLKGCSNFQMRKH